MSKIHSLLLFIVITLMTGCPFIDKPGDTASNTFNSCALFVSDRENLQAKELYKAGLSGEPVTRLSTRPNYDYPVSVHDFKLSPDNRFIAYSIIFSQGGYGGNELYIVSAADNNSVKVAGSLLESDHITDYQWAPDGSKLAFITHSYITGNDLIIFDPITNTKTRISGEITNKELINALGALEFTWAPDSSSIAYRAAYNDPRKADLYTAHPDGSGQTLLSADLPVVDWGAHNFSWSPDSHSLVFLAAPYLFQDIAYYTIHSDGTERIKLIDGKFNEIQTGQMIWSHDSEYLAYSRKNQSDSFYSLYAIQANGKDILKLSESDFSNINEYSWSPTQHSIVYSALYSGHTNNELFIVDLDKSTHTKITNTNDTGGGVYSIKWSRDGRKVAYNTDQVTRGNLELYSVNSDGTNVVKISADTIIHSSRSSISNYQWAPDNSALAFRVETQIDGLTNTFYTVTPDGSELQLINENKAGKFIWGMNSSRIMYEAYDSLQDRVDLYTILPNGTEDINISNSTVTGGRVDNGYVLLD